jgi:hypothetical protein
MSTQHTPEPWKIVEHNWEHTGIYPESGHRIAVCEINPEVDENTQERYEAINDANARRIVACVNACAGIPTEVLENIGAGMGPNWLQARQERDALKQQNAELLASCNSFRDCVLHQRWNLEDNGMTSDQINDVLNLFDTLIGDEIAKAGQL